MKLLENARKRLSAPFGRGNLTEFLEYTSNVLKGISIIIGTGIADIIHNRFTNTPLTQSESSL